MRIDEESASAAEVLLRPRIPSASEGCSWTLLASVDLIEKEIAAGGLVFPDCAKFGEGLEAIGPYLDLGPVVQSFWLDPRHQAGRTWHDHQDINDVMLAASLLPEGGLLRLGAS